MAVAEQDRHGSARVLEQIVRGELAHLGGRCAFRVADMNRVRVAIEVDAFRVDDDQLRAALADGLLDPKVHDRDVVLGV